MFILDTDHLGVLQRGRGAEYDRISQRIAEIGDVNIFVTIVSFHEIVAGWTKYVKQSTDQGKIVAGYGRLEKILSDFAAAHRRLDKATSVKAAFELPSIDAQ